MLFILFGSTVEMGKKSRLFFEEHGFELIQKFNYIPGDPVVQARFDRRKQSSREEVENCDFVYENNGMLIGFNKEQIIDSVRGRKNCLLTLSSDTIEFIRQIKAAYGGYVTIVGVYIDQLQLKKMFEAIPDLTREELEARLKTGEMVKKIMLEERKLFDEIVIYGGEDSLFDFQGLYSQYEWMIEKASRKEKELNDKTYVEMPYSDGVTTVAEADSLFEDKVTFVLDSPQYGRRLGLFAAGGQAIIAPYITQELIANLQGAALQYLNLNRPQYTLAQAKLLEDYLTSDADARYVQTKLLDYVNISVSLENKNYVGTVSVSIPEPTALWRLKGILTQEAL